MQPVSFRFVIAALSVFSERGREKYQAWYKLKLRVVFSDSLRSMNLWGMAQALIVHCGRKKLQFPLPFPRFFVPLQPKRFVDRFELLATTVKNAKTTSVKCALHAFSLLPRPMIMNYFKGHHNYGLSLYIRVCL